MSKILRTLQEVEESDESKEIREECRINRNFLNLNLNSLAFNEIHNFLATNKVGMTNRRELDERKRT